MFSVGDKVTIRRGKGGSQEGTIKVAAQNGQEYGVETADGNLRVVKADNLKAPAESTIGEGRLAAEIQTAVTDTAFDDTAQDALRALISRLSGDMPGLAARISWPAEAVAQG